MGKKVYTMKLKWFLLLSILVGSLIATFFYVRYHLSETESFHARKANKPIPVKVWRVVQKDFDVIIGAPALSVPFREVKVSSSLEDVVISNVFFDVGDLVHKGDILLSVDKELLELEFKSAKARLNHAKIALDNAKLFYKNMLFLFNKGFISKVELNDAAEQLKDAEYEYADSLVEFKHSYQRLNYSSIKSPCSGIIVERDINPGEQYFGKTPMFIIDQLDPILIDALVPEEDINLVKKGQHSSVEFSIWPGKAFKGIVYKIQPKIGNTKTFHVYIKLHNSKLMIKPGMTGFVQIFFTKRAILVPNIALLKTVARRSQIFVVDKSNRVHLREVIIGQMNDKFTEVVKGVSINELVVISGLKGLRDGDVVSIKP